VVAVTEGRQIRKLLIANRGEIAVRIARTCRRMGIRSVAVSSDADRRAMHVRNCDEAYHIGPPPATESYLRGDRIIEVAREAGCDTIHPGYGFLSENAGFARAVAEAGLIWIGPSPEAITLMGSKIESKRLAEANGVPIVPGYFGDDQSPATLTTEAERLGYPLLIKASAGGGGKGMRVVERPDDLIESLEGAKREAKAAFGDDSVMLERYLSRPRHIEVQVLGDLHGTVLHLGERECSIQRRHQKVLEESPSPALTPEMRNAITGAALTLVRAAGYSNAGTVEFIFQEGEFYFLEMNTRLQVEHPVTEEALGLDLVELQIRLAAGAQMPIRQEDVRFKGHAIEVRLYAEDPQKGFLPATGTLLRFTVPYSSPDLRIDAGVERGDAVSPYYDPMIAKIISRGPNRESAVATLATALGSIVLEGITTNIAFLRWLVNHPAFEAGELSTHFIEEHYTPGAFHEVPADAVVRAATTFRTGDQLMPSEAGEVWVGGPWRQAGVAMRLPLEVDGLRFDMEFERDSTGGALRGRVIHGESVLHEGLVSTRGPGVSSQQPTANSQQRATFVEADKRAYFARLAPPPATERMNPVLHLEGEESLESPMPGTVLKVSVEPEERVEEGQALAVVEAMKMEFTIRAPHDGRVKTIHYERGAQVAAGDVLIEMYPPDDKGDWAKE
jgi:3-methylcrotonyl-CoA carboxylase alpha subunit